MPCIAPAAATVASGRPLHAGWHRTVAPPNPSTNAIPSSKVAKVRIVECSYSYQFAKSPLGFSGTSSIPIARNSGHMGPTTGSTISSAPGTSSRPSGASIFVSVQWSEIVSTS